jgi:hypothetical protein
MLLLMVHAVFVCSHHGLKPSLAGGATTAKLLCRSGLSVSITAAGSAVRALRRQLALQRMLKPEDEADCPHR